MASRRHFVAGLVAATLAPRPSWAEAGNPAYLAAARAGEGYDLFGLSEDGTPVFRIPLPARGHAAAAHPTRPDAAVFARRPGAFAVVFDCRDGTVRRELIAPSGRSLYGHGSYSADGTLLLTTEMDAQNRGRIGLWDVAAGYARAGDFASGGIGPHEVLRLADGGYAIANGGIETGGANGREKLNLDRMAPNLTRVSASGAVTETVELPPELHQQSIRHVASRPDGLVAFGMQWQGAPDLSPPLLGLHRPGQGIRLLQAPEGEHRGMQGYVGSVAFSNDGTLVAITSPLGGMAQVFDPDSGDYVGSFASPDICGVAPGPSGFTVTTGAGRIAGLSAITPMWQNAHPQEWDHHLIRIAPL